MLDFVINSNELAAMSGLTHIQQLTYLRGIRPYMDVKTGITGIKRRISHQSISEQLYIEPHQGIKSQSFSRDQVRRAVYGLVRAGLIEVQSDGMQLILKCPLASTDYFVQNKAAIKPPQKVATPTNQDNTENIRVFGNKTIYPATPKTIKAAIPQYNNYYIFLFKQFEKFWELYPVKKSQQQAWQVFQELNPSSTLIEQILLALQAQVNFIQQQKAQGLWVPNWKNPANWLTQQCWADELTQYSQDINNANYETSHTQPTAYDPLWSSCGSGSENESGKNGEDEASNVISFARRANERETY
ncbi:hypothetical protein ACNVED_13190 [Legionella sp. D16C41]|uniref:hypothetical protein n=1 Tax=Legionella sp. D16C41 TaxID=3402688 RepID=UPI003AF5D100